MKKLSETYKELGIAFTSPIEIKDADGNQTYHETNRGYWCKREYDAKAQRHPRYAKALDIALSAPTNYTRGADHYHADYFRPYWAKHMKVTATIGRHIFYN
jgi:spore germination cell wall hydrolase CwlJ-like protein